MNSAIKVEGFLYYLSHAVDTHVGIHSNTYCGSSPPSYYDSGADFVNLRLIDTLSLSDLENIGRVQVADMAEAG